MRDFVSTGFGALLLGMSTLATASQAPATSDVAILIQAGHSATPNKVIAYHSDDASFLETWDGINVRLWRRPGSADEWRMLRHWKNLLGAWSHSPKDELRYFSANVDGFFELYDAHTWERLYRVSTSMPAGEVPSAFTVSGTTGDAAIVTLDELDAQGRKFLSLHLASPGQAFAPWQPLTGQTRITRFIELANGLFAARLEDRSWQLLQVSNDGRSEAIQLPGLPGRLPQIRALHEGFFGVALYEPSLRRNKDDGATWHLFRTTEQGEILAQSMPGLEPGAIKNVSGMSEGFIRLTERASSDVDAALLTRFYRLNETRQPTPAHELIAGLPVQARNFRVLADGRVVGAAEVDDADHNGRPGNWTWRLQDAHGQWRELQYVLPGMRGEIWAVSDWLDGQGLGVQTVPADGSSSYDWHWFLRDQESGKWLPVAQVLPLQPGLAIDTIRDRRDGLIEVVATPDQQGPADADSPVPVAVQNVHWMMRAEDGNWDSVRDLVAKHRPGLEKLIIAVDARANGLMVDIKRSHDEAPLRLLLYKNRDHQWVMLDNAFRAMAGSVAQGEQRPFPKAQRAQVLADGRLVLLREQGDANWDGESDDTQLLQATSQGWRLLRAQNVLGGKAAQLRYEPDLGLLVRTGHAAGSRHFFRLDEQGNWTDIRSMVTDAPAKIDSAFLFAAGDGLAIKEQLDADGNGRFGEWRFYYRGQQGWQAISASLPDGFPAIQTVIDAGGRAAISVQEAGDANDNGVAGEWRHYYRHGDRWVDLQRQWAELPAELSELQLSADGRVLTATEEWDANGNGTSFERIAGVWSERDQGFVAFSALIDQPAATVSDLRSLWNGQGLAVQTATEQVAGGDADARVQAGQRWQLYQRSNDGSWHPLPAGADNLAEVRADQQGRLLALRRQGSEAWELWVRDGTRLARWQPAKDASLRDVRLDVGSGMFAIQLRDLWRDGEQRWQLWRQDAGGVSPVGYSATPSWFGLDHRAVSQGQLRFDNAEHYLDGRRVDNVPQPTVWFHRLGGVASQGDSVLAPELLDQALTAPDGNSAPLRVSALGYGPHGSVIIYQSRARRLVVGFSEGPAWMENRPLLGGNGTAAKAGELALLVNRFPDGTERLFRADAPDRWLWSYRHHNGRIYYDDAGYFFNETDAASEMLTFRVGLQIHSFAQLGSYLFRPDLLEKRLGLPQRSLFELTQRDAERIELARRLAPEGVDIATLEPPHIAVTASATSVDEPFVELQLLAEGFGVDEHSVAVRILGAGQARGVPPRPSGGQRQQLRLSKRVPLVPGLNRLEITVYDAHGLSHSQRLEVTFKPKVERKPTLYAAVVATSNYKGTNSLASLPLTQNDARTITAALMEQSGKRFDKVVLRSWCQEDGCISQPTRRQLMEELPRFLADAKNGDYIVVYVSGHGLKIGTEYFMVPEDGDPALPSTLVAWSQIQGWLRGARLGKKVVLLDTCQSGAVFQRQRDQRRMVQQAAEHDGIYVLSASAADASAYEMSSIGNGLFTYVVNEGLVGQADAGSDGNVSFEELSFHVARRVRELSSAQHVRMEPYVPIIDQQMDFNLVNVKSRQLLFLRVSDISTFDNSALAGRAGWWQMRIDGLNSDLSLSSQQAAPYRLVVVEDQGKPIRSQLSKADGKVLGQWHFSDTSTDSMLQTLVNELAVDHQAVTACGASRGLTLDPVCGQ